MTLIWKDRDFEMYAGVGRPRTCLAVEPGVVDFPARCVRSFDHDGKHQSTVGYAGGRPTEITYWDNDE